MASSGSYPGLWETWHSYRILILTVLALQYLVVRWLLKKKRWQRQVEATNEVVEQKPTFSEEIQTFSGHPAVSVRPIAQPAAVPERVHTTPSPGSRNAVKRVAGSRLGKRSKLSPSSELPAESTAIVIQPHVFFSSLTGSTEAYAKKVRQDIQDFVVSQQLRNINQPEIHDLSYIDYDDFFLSVPKDSVAGKIVRPFYLLLLPTYNIDTILSNFLDHLKETHHDFRIDTAPLSALLGYSVFGFGDREGWPTEQEGFCSQAMEADKWMAKLTDRKRAFPLGTGDVKSDASQRLEDWTTGVGEILAFAATNGYLGEGVAGSGDAAESGDEEEEDDMEETVTENHSPAKSKPTSRKKSNLDDLEDLGRKRPFEDSLESVLGFSSSSPIPMDLTTSSKQAETVTPKQMVPVNSPTYTSLTKQGYSIIGSHSGVKICRWTKSALRGRGSCYKHSFYGIASHLCMETTPSLSCSNKCVFCWRHGTNPVGTTWRWTIDPPELIYDGAKAAHYQKIKMMRGVPGVRADRFTDAMRIRHCALSLVGEPIFYPHINAFLALLHRDHISSFLVCNAQHPAELAALQVCTQLYVSIDASNRESLRRIDRPLHRDFWERFTACLDILRERRDRMRTVYRLTLVKGFNVEDEVSGYADLVAQGLPCFVEIKGVTYCGTSTGAAAGLTMQNVPFYEEVQAFVVALEKALNARGLDYGIGAEHAHSCCVLLASRKFYKKGRWHTQIDYDRFFHLLEGGRPFGPEDYVGEATPEWAAWGRGGFDPSDQRVDRKGRKIER